MRFTYFFFLLYFFTFTACKQQKIGPTKIVGDKIEINDSLSIDSEIEAFIKPYRIHIQKDLDSVLAYSIDTYSKTDGQFNTAIGNFMADAVYTQANPVFKARTKNSIDFVLLNYGGIRSIISKGNITARTAYKVMPFENSIVVAGLKGDKIKNIVDYIVSSKRAVPFSSQLKLKIDKDYNILSVTINDNTIDSTKTYYVATSDYTYNMGDNMTFFKPNEGVTFLDYKIRKALIDNFKKIDTLKPVIDDRYIQIN